MGAGVIGKTTLFLLAAALAGIVYPLLNEQTWSPCAAVERRFLTLTVAQGDAGEVLSAAIAKEFLGIGDGAVAEAIAGQRKPGIAAFATCYGYYWHSIYDRKWLLEFGIQGFVK